ncbi:nuclear factor NF-kappa-B family member relish [Anticarsia gemmatalis]|uniref:nuclear factor NF-kappa-B family member relish n=1 Tax=Anticarsia gemmatalis TaxID=129554 RepID=UPI003F7696E5
MSSSPSDHDMSDSSSSGTSYNMRYSPYDSPSQQVPQLTSGLTELTCADNKRQFLKHATRPFLQIIEQPQNHFRFRYVSEMIGTHGCLLGKSYGSNKTKTHPTVELVNYPGQALVRCHLAQHNNPEEHPHKLLEDEQDRDVSQLVPEQGSYRVAFGGIGIIHTAKKDVPALLLKKLLEKNRNPNVNVRDLQTKCENMAKTINLNIVRLKFSAHDVHTGEEICDPVLSEPIHNMKSAATNDLKICRISRSSGSASGGEDVFILVEKVNKKNIMIRFFELDENGERSWTGVGQFMQSDVHHQYAIVFRTPPYKDPKTPVDVQVFIELVRPSDGRTSEPKDFKFKAEQAYKQIKKRKTNSSYCSIGSSSSGSLRSTSDLPLTVLNHQEDIIVGETTAVPTVPNAFSMYSTQMQYTASPNQCDLASALAGSEASLSPMSSPMWAQGTPGLPVVEPPITDLHLNSGELDDLPKIEPESRILSEGMTQFFSEYLKSYEDLGVNADKVLESLEFRPSMIVSDSGRANYIKQEKKPSNPDLLEAQNMWPPSSKGNETSDSNKKNAEYSAFYKTEDGIEVKKLVKDLCEMIRNKNGFKKQEVRSRLERLFNIRLSNGDTFLHMTLCSNQASLEYVVKIIHNVKATHLLDCVNDRQQTTLHLAILNDLPKIVSLLVAKGSNPMLKDAKDLNAIHYAVKYKSCLEPLLDAIKKNDVPCNLNECNSERQSALHMAVVEGCARSTRALLAHGASYSVRDVYGRTPLHLAAYDDRLDVTRTLLDFIPLSEIDVMDDSGNTALQIVCGGTIRENTVAIGRLLLEKKANPMKTEGGNESAWRLVRNKPELKALLGEFVATDLMDEDDIKSEPEDDFESADEGEFPELGLAELAQYAREVAALLDAAGAWRGLARRLRLDALLDWYAAQPSPTLTLLNHLKDSRDDITSKSLALVLDDMGQKSAANVIRRYIE